MAGLENQTFLIDYEAPIAGQLHQVSKTVIKKFGDERRTTAKENE